LGVSVAKQNKTKQSVFEFKSIFETK